MHSFLVSLQQLLDAVGEMAGDHRAVLTVLVTSAIGSGLGAWFGAAAILRRDKDRIRRDIQATANIAIASMIALLGRLIHVKKDLAFPAHAEAQKLGEILADKTQGKISIGLRLWPEFSFGLGMPAERIFEHTAKELAVVQLVRTLEFNLQELEHMIRQRNALIQQMNAHQTARGALPLDGMTLYADYARRIAQNLDEDLFFIDKAIEKIRLSACRLLPKKMHKGIASIGLMPETQALMPAKDLIKGWVK